MSTVSGHYRVLRVADQRNIARPPTLLTRQSDGSDDPVSLATLLPGEIGARSTQTLGRRFEQATHVSVPRAHPQQARLLHLSNLSIPMYPKKGCRLFLTEGKVNYKCGAMAM